MTYLLVGVTKREGISIQETKRSDHIFITKEKKKISRIAICHSFAVFHTL